MQRTRHPAHRHTYMLTYEGPHLVYVPNYRHLDLHEQPEFRQFAAAVLMDSKREPHPYGKPFIKWVEGRFNTTLADVAKAIHFLYGRDAKKRFFTTVHLEDNFLAD